MSESNVSKFVSKFVSQPLISIETDAPMADAAKRMSEARVRHLPVTHAGKIVGIISDRDVERAANVHLHQWGDISIQDKTFNPAHEVRHFMSTRLISVDLNVQLDEAAKLMLAKRISSVLITENDTPIGIVTTDDLLKVLVEHVSQNRAAAAGSAPRWAIDLMNTPIGTLIEQLSITGI